MNVIQDAVQARLAAYAHTLNAGAIPPATLHAARVRVIDTLGAVLGGFDDEPNRIARALAADVPLASGATLLGTALKVPVDMAAFVNGTVARSAEINDVYHAPGSKNGHPSDVIMPLLAVAETTRTNGHDFLVAVVLAYEIYLRFANRFTNRAIDSTNFCCIGVAAASAKLMGLNQEQIAEALAMAAVPNGALNQSRTGHLTMWKSVAAGQAGRAGVFAAQLAAKGMRGATEPFTGKHGWFEHIAKVAPGEITLDVMGGHETPFRINDTLIKPRMACLHTLAPILAGEKAAAQLNGRLKEIEHVQVAVYRANERAVVSVDKTGGADPHWHPDSRETADHSVPYCVAATLLDGSVTQHSFDAAHLNSPALRGLLAVTELREDPAFTKAYEKHPVEYRCRVSVRLRGGQTVVGETGGEHGDLSDAKSDAEIAAKFRGFAGMRLGEARANALLDRLWVIDALSDVAVLPPLLSFKASG